MLTIGYIHGGTVREEFLQSLLMSVVMDTQQRRMVNGVLGVPTSILAHGRNALCHQFLQSDDTHLLMVDTDMVFTLEDVYALLDADKPAIAGLYLSRHDNHLVWSGEGHQQITEVPPYPIKLKAAGTGFLLVHREVLEKMRADSDDPWPWFGHDMILGVRAGEDISFCNRMAALGIELYGHGGVHIGHVGTTTLWPADHQEV